MLCNNIVIRPVTYIRIHRVVSTGDQRTSLKAQQPAKRKRLMAQVTAEHPVTVYLSINSLRGKTSVQIWTEKWPIVLGSASLHVFKSNATELHFLHCMIICVLILPSQMECFFSHVLRAGNECWGADKKKGRYKEYVPILRAHVVHDSKLIWQDNVPRLLQTLSPPTSY